MVLSPLRMTMMSTVIGMITMNYMKYTDPSLWSNMDTPAWVALASQNNDEQDQNDGMLTVEWKVTVVEVKHVNEDDEEGDREMKDREDESAYCRVTLVGMNHQTQVWW